MNHKAGKDQNDHDLVQRVLDGNVNNFSAIIKATERLVAQIIFKMISNNEDRKDLAQEVYLKAFNKLGDFKFQSKLSTWIGQITYNSCINYLDKKKLVLSGSGQEEENATEDGFETFIGHLSNPSNIETEKLISQKELSGILKAEIEKLSPIFKTMITLFHNEELSYEEIAHITELPIGTVKSYLFRARKSLKENILAKYKFEDL